MLKFYKRFLTKKILIVSLALITLLLISLIPRNEVLQEKLPQKLEYVNYDIVTNKIFLLDSNNYLGKTEVVINSTNLTLERKAKELIEILIKGGTLENKIPSGFQAILPSETKILSVKCSDDLIKIDFSKDLLNVKKEYEEKMVEAIVYTLTNIEGINKVIIYIEGDILSKLPQTKINLPSTLDRSFGINKTFDLKETKNVEQVTIYYLNKFNEDYYYVPITKYLNDSREKIEIVIEELSSSHIYNNNLMSFLNNNAKLLAVEQNNDVLELQFNNYLFNDLINEEILEEVILTICLSVKDNYDALEVVFKVEDEEILSKVLKTIE